MIKLPKIIGSATSLDNLSSIWKERDAKKILDKRLAEGKHVCGGIDPDWDLIPAHLKEGGRSQLAVLVGFCIDYIDATHKYVAAYKLNAGFFESYYPFGLQAARYVISYIHIMYPEILVVYDGKRGDIGPSNKKYTVFPFDIAGADALTISGYLGRSEAFLEFKNKIFFYLVYTSNPEASEIQELTVLVDGEEVYLYQVMADKVSGPWDTNFNCGVVATATKPEVIADTREIIGDDVPMLIPAVGRQKGKLEASARAGGYWAIINNSSGIMHASTGIDYIEAQALAAKAMHEAIVRALA